MRFELIKEFQYVNPERQILSLAVNNIVEKVDANWYGFEIRGKAYKIESAIVESNPAYFKLIDWRVDLLEMMKDKRKATLPALHKSVVGFIEENLMNKHELIEQTVVLKMLEAVKRVYLETLDEEWNEIFSKIGYIFDENKITKNK